MHCNSFCRQFPQLPLRMTSRKKRQGIYICNRFRTPPLSSYMIPVRPSPPLPPPPMVPPPPRPPVVWCGCGLLPSPPCGVVWLWVASPLPVLWCGSGVGFGGSPLPPCGVVWVGWFPPACLHLLGVLGKPMLMMILMMMMMTIIMIIIITIIFVFLWLVVGYLLPTCLLTIMALLTVGPRSL